ncbi:MAG: restriction endonuclease subunit S [Porticoccaceae bacterium]
MMEWPLVKLGDICRIELGKTPSRGDVSLWDKEKKGSNIWLSIADLPLTEKPVMLDSKEYISDKGAGLCKVIPAGTLMVSFKLSLGRLAYAGTDLFSNEAIASLYTGKDIDIAKDYLYWALTNFDWDKAVGADVKVKGKTLNKAKLISWSVGIETRFEG